MVDAPFYARPEFWLYFAAWAPYTLLVAVYGLGSPWWRSAIGRSLLLTKVVIVAVLSNVLATFAFGDYTGRDTVRVLLIGLVICAGWYQLVTIARVQRRGRREQPHPARRATDHPTKGALW